MQMLDNVIILLLILGAFIFGLRLSSYYHTNAAEHERYMLRKQYARLQAGLDADDIAQPYVAPQVRQKFTAPPEFINALKRGKRATMRVDNTKAT